MSIYNSNSCRLSKENSLCKPLASIERLSKIANDDAETFLLPRNRRLPIFDISVKPCIYIMTEGRFAISRNSDGLYLTSINSPLVLGLAMMFEEVLSQERRHALFSETECRGYKVPAEEAIKKITMLSLWPDVATILAYFLELLVDRDENLIGVNAYSMVRYNLIKIIEYSKSERMNINVEKFIHQHTRLSRSGIMKILSDLRFGGYIDMDRGRLISINNLPENY